MKEVWYYPTLFGEVAIATENNMVTALCLKKNFKRKEYIYKENPLMEKTIKELHEYFLGKRKIFDLPLAPEGTAYQKRVWQCLINIPYGEIRTYKDIAIEIGNEKGCRSIGSACSKNPIWILIPCHRVIGTNGTLTGYAGGLMVKEHLLALEKNRER